MLRRFFLACLLGPLVTGACKSERVLEPDPVFIVTPRSPLTQSGMILQMKVLAPSEGSPLAEPVTWTSSNTGVASIDADGVVTSVAAGTTLITATSGSVSDTTTVEVQEGQDGFLIASGDLNCGLTTTAGAVCWGENLFGQTGTRSTSQIVFTPTPVAASVEWRSLDASWNHTCGVDTQFDVYCWGLNDVGQLGMGTDSDPVFPSKKVTSDDKFVLVSAGGAQTNHILSEFDFVRSQQTCALTRKGEAMCWGLQANSVAGDARSNTPRIVAPGIQFVSLAVGSGFVCAVSIERRVYCWGNNDLGQLGRARNAFDTGPRPIDSDARFKRVSAAGLHACAIAIDDSAYCWGVNTTLQLGATSNEQCTVRGRTYSCSAKPLEVGGGFKFRSLSPGSWGSSVSFISQVEFTGHTCGVTTQQDIVCWGSNNAAAIRQPIHFDPLPIQPVQLSFPNNKFKAVATGAAHTCAELVTGQVWCWGSNSRGQQGIPQGTSRGTGFGAVAGAFVFR